MNNPAGSLFLFFSGLSSRKMNWSKLCSRSPQGKMYLKKKFVYLQIEVHYCPFAFKKFLQLFFLPPLPHSARNSSSSSSDVLMRAVPSLLTNESPFGRKQKKVEKYPGSAKQEPRSGAQCRVLRYYFTPVILACSARECGGDLHQ